MSTLIHSNDHPPRVSFTAAIGITGHRAHVLVDDKRATVGERLGALLTLVRQRACHFHAAQGAAFSAEPPLLRMVSALADGADQIAARIGVDGGYRLRALLPFEHCVYAQTFSDPAARPMLQTLIGAADSVLELPGDPLRPEDAYVMAGRAIVAHSDILVAVWDGLPARGHGGTADVVAHALHRGLPVIHIPVDDAAPLRIIWSGYDPFVTHLRVDDIPARLFDPAALDALLTALFAPPHDPRERACLDMFQAETERRIRHRVEYPLLLAATGVRRLRLSVFHIAGYAQATHTEWAKFRAFFAPGDTSIRLPLDTVQAAYCWSDSLAQHFAQTYRSGHIFNFILAAVAVLLALSGLLQPEFKIQFAVAELLAILAFVLNTRVGVARRWQGRWLDYRQLAERLRPMRSMKLLGVAQPDYRPTREGGKGSWVDWYAAGIWRSIDTAAGAMARTDVTALSTLIIDEEVAPQIAYNRRSAAQLRHLDHRLHQIGMTLFIASIASCVAFIAGYFIAYDWVKHNAAAFVALSAGLPAMGSALFGIRMQGDFNGSAERAAATADRLDDIAQDMIRHRDSLPRTADLLEEAARAMVADLGEWRLSQQQRRLEIPG